MAEIGRLPGVRSVSGAETVPLGLEHWVTSMKVWRTDQHPRVHVNSVTPGYFRTMHIKLIDGRDFDVTDRQELVPRRDSQQRVRANVF